MDSMKFKAKYLPKIVYILGSYDIEVLSVEEFEKTMYIAIDVGFVMNYILAEIYSDTGLNFGVASFSSNAMSLCFSLE